MQGGGLLSKVPDSLLLLRPWLGKRSQCAHQLSRANPHEKKGFDEICTPTKKSLRGQLAVGKPPSLIGTYVPQSR
jgi:hypothetical protein